MPWTRSASSLHEVHAAIGVGSIRQRWISPCSSLHATSIGYDSGPKPVASTSRKQGKPVEAMVAADDGEGGGGGNRQECSPPQRRGERRCHGRGTGTHERRRTAAWRPLTETGH